jgi:hypothetical protein
MRGDYGSLVWVNDKVGRECVCIAEGNAGDKRDLDAIRKVNGPPVPTPTASSLRSLVGSCCEAGAVDKTIVSASDFAPVIVLCVLPNKHNRH